MGLRDRRLTAGADFAQRIEDLESGANTAGSPRVLRSRTSTLMDAFALVRPMEWMDKKKRSTFGVVGRVDRFKIDKSATVANPNYTFMVLGGFWDLTPRVQLALDYQWQSPRNTPTTAVASKTWFLHWQANF